ncbi:MAG: PEGA domain-containing protein [Deltaproteobacteria bacterium]|nr:PEGA domain-containing protein [Deltaproteobacteria bacterium]
MARTERCSRCGRLIAPGSTFCPGCGGLAVPTGSRWKGKLPMGSSIAGCEITGSATHSPVTERYVARDLDSGEDREVVLVFPPGELQPEALKRFILFLESYKAESGSPGLLRVFRYIQEHGCIYIVTEPAPGPALDSKLVGMSGAFRALDRKNAVQLLLGACKIIKNFHTRLQPYFGISPKRIFLSGERGVILDLPIEPWLVPNWMTWPWLTYFEAGYIAPEVLQGDPVSPPADIYALGALAFHVTTGRPPMGLGKAPSELAFSAPKRLDGVIERAMAEQPSNRYLTVGDLAHDIEHAFTEATEQKDSEKKEETGSNRSETGTGTGISEMKNSGSKKKNKRGINSKDDYSKKKKTRSVATLLLLLVPLLIFAGYLVFVEKGLKWSGTENKDESRLPAILSVESEPPGALVNLDGEVLGRAPIRKKIKIIAGTHYLRLSKEHYVDVLKELKLEPGRNKIVKVNLVQREGVIESP